MFNVLAKYFKWIWTHSKGVRSAIVFNIFLGVLSVALNLFFIWISKRLIDVATGDALPLYGTSYETLIILCALLFIAMFLRIAVNALSTHIEGTTYSKVNFIIRKRLFSNLLQAQWQGKEKMHTGDTLNRIFTDVDTVTRVLIQELPSLFVTLFQLSAAFVFLAMMDFRLALILLALTPLFLAFSRVFFKKMRALTLSIKEIESRVQGHIQESLQYKTVIQSLEKGEMAEERLGALQQNEYEQVLRRTRFSVFSHTTMSAAFGTGYAIALIWGVFGIYDGIFTFGVLAAFLQLVGQIQGPSMRLARQIPSFVYATASIDRLDELEAVEKEERGEPVRLEAPVGVRIENLTFSYPDGDSPVFHNFSHDFRPGSRTAVIGETGAGKSTLIRLILSLLKPQEGRIVFYSSDSGKDAFTKGGQAMVKEAEASPFTRINIVYVPQGNTMLSGTIRDNLLLGDPSADDALLWQALEKAAAGFVRELPDGLDTVCGEKGTGLSEGQAQRIAIARGLLRPGSVLLLDEFSSSLDPETEERLLENLASGMSEDKTMIFITHREAAAKYCDRVLRIE